MRKRMGLILILGGVMLSAMAFLLMMGISRNAQRASAEVKQVQVVIANQDIPEGTALTAEMLELKAFPAEFAPEAAVSGEQEAVSKFTVTRVVKDQIITAPILSTTKQAGALALSIPKGKVAYALPRTDLLSANSAIRPGDYVDVLVTFTVKAAVRAGMNGNNDEDLTTTQKTLQNVQVLDLYGEGAGGSAGSSGVSAVVFLLDHQQAVALKAAKDAGGIIDLTLRGSDDDRKAVTTDGETVDSQIVKWKFRKPQPVR